MSIKRLVAICIIVAFTTLAWFILGGALTFRSDSSESRLSPEVAKNWGPPLTQEHPTLFYEAPTSARTRREIQPERSDLSVRLTYEPNHKGLLWYRTFFADFKAEYLIKNPTPISQTIYAVFKFPSADARYDKFSLAFGDKLSDKAPSNGELRESHVLAPGQELPLKITYRAAGTNSWIYNFSKARRIQNLHLEMQTNFAKVNMPPGAESPTTRRTLQNGWEGHWDYTDVLGANAFGRTNRRRGDTQH